MLVWTTFLMLILLSAACALAFSRRGRAMLLSSARGFLFCTAVLVAWLGYAANESTVALRNLEDGFEGSVSSLTEDFLARLRAMLAGTILLIMAMLLLAVVLLLLDRAHTSASLRALVAEVRPWLHSTDLCLWLNCVCPRLP